MRGPCCDALNPANRPTPEQLRGLGASGVRLVLRESARFDWYYTELTDAGDEVAVVLARESTSVGLDSPHEYRAEIESYARRLSESPPLLWLIGNEPNGGEGASWVLSPVDYQRLWTIAAAAIRGVLPEAQLYVGGLLGSAGGAGEGYLDSIWDQLHPAPSGIDIHYPDTEQIIGEWSAKYGAPLSVMEWAWVGGGVTQADVVGWQRVLDRWADHSAWYSWGDDAGQSMALVGPSGYKRKAWYHYRAALKAAVR